MHSHLMYHFRGLITQIIKSKIKNKNIKFWKNSGAVVLLVLYMYTKFCTRKPSFRHSKVAPTETYNLSFAKTNVAIRKDKVWHRYVNFQYIKFLYLETWFNFLHFIFFYQCKILCVSISKNTSKLRVVWLFRFLLHLTHQKWSS